MRLRQPKHFPAQDAQWLFALSGIWVISRKATATTTALTKHSSYHTTRSAAFGIPGDAANAAPGSAHISYWPNLIDFSPAAVEPKKTYNGGTHTEQLVRLDGFIDELMDELEKLGIAENTLLVIMADNGPMVHNPPSLCCGLEE